MSGKGCIQTNKHIHAHTQIQIYLNKLNVHLSVLLSVFCARSFWLFVLVPHLCALPSCQDQTQAQTQISNRQRFPWQRPIRKPSSHCLSSPMWCWTVCVCVCVLFFESVFVYAGCWELKEGRWGRWCSPPARGPLFPPVPAAIAADCKHLCLHMGSNINWSPLAPSPHTRPPPRPHLHVHSLFPCVYYILNGKSCRNGWVFPPAAWFLMGLGGVWNRGLGGVQEICFNRSYAAFQTFAMFRVLKGKW